MTRRLLAFVLALAVASGTQGTLMYAAAAPAAAATGVRMASAQAVDVLVATAPAVAALPGADALGDVLTESAVQCQRGADACFGYFSNNCCAEMFTLMAIAGAVGAWVAAGVSAYYYWYYC